MTSATLELEAAPATETTTMPRRSPSRRTTRIPERLVLTGFMGSGKTTVGRLLADRLGWAFTDLDTEIERRSGLTVPEIFSTLGEKAFRQQETAALAHILGQTRTVIALGGGAPEALGNQLLLEQTPATAVVFLAAPFATLLDRCEQQAASEGIQRPVLADHTAAEARFHTRQRIYNRIAAHKLDTTSLTPEDAVNHLINTLNLN
jgi:shikimate kinase